MINLIIVIIWTFCRLVKLENIGYVDQVRVKEQSQRQTKYATVRRADIDSVISKITYSDWLVLYYLAQAMDKGHFGELMAKLASELPEYPYATDEEAAAMRKLQEDGKTFYIFNTDNVQGIYGYSKLLFPYDLDFDFVVMSLIFLT